MQDFSGGGPTLKFLGFGIYMPRSVMSRAAKLRAFAKGVNPGGDEGDISPPCFDMGGITYLLSPPCFDPQICCFFSSGKLIMFYNVSF